jgi:hypothetical protein
MAKTTIGEGLDLQEQIREQRREIRSEHLFRMADLYDEHVDPVSAARGSRDFPEADDACLVVAAIYRAAACICRTIEEKA